MIWLALLLAQAGSDPAVVARGEKVFAQSCSVGYCHGSGGAASRGPRLRGRRFERSYLVRVVRDGLPNTAMPAFRTVLRDSDVDAVLAYVVSLADAKADAEPLTAVPGLPPAPAARFEGPAEAKRGRDLFFDAARGTRCGTCHEVDGLGAPVGPDVKKSSVAHARLIESREVATARLKNGESFPALVVERTPQWIKLYDLTAPPPVLRTLEPSELAALEQQSGWQHAAAIRGYTDSELAAIAAYLKWLRK